MAPMAQHRDAYVCFVNGNSYNQKCGWRVKIETCTCSYDLGATVVHMYKLPRVQSCNRVRQAA